MILESVHDLSKNKNQLLDYLRNANLIKNSLRCKKCTREKKEEKIKQYIYKNVKNIQIEKS